MTEKPTAEILMGKDIVVIDDDINSLDVASIVLEFAGANVFQAENGKEGLVQISKVEPFLVLSDISMPIMDGWDFIKNLRDNDAYKDLMVIALTAHAMIGDRDKVLEAGYNGYLTKPLQPAKFVKELLSVMENASKNSAPANATVENEEDDQTLPSKSTVEDSKEEEATNVTVEAAKEEATSNGVTVENANNNSVSSNFTKE